MTRFDLFTTVHKGLRAALFGAVQQAGRADFTQTGEADAVAASVRRALSYLAEHAEHEAREIVPEIGRHSAELAADLGADHARTGGLEQQVLDLADRLAGAMSAERLSIGRRLSHRLAQLTAEHLRHMEREEVQANRVLWAHRTDEELAAIHGRIVAAIAPSRIAEWMELLLPAVNATEGEQLRSSIAAGEPA